MKKRPDDYDSDAEYWASQPTIKIVLFAVTLVLAAAIIWVYERIELCFIR